MLVNIILLVALTSFLVTPVIVALATVNRMNDRLKKYRRSNTHLTVLSDAELIALIKKTISKKTFKGNGTLLLEAHTLLRLLAIKPGLKRYHFREIAIAYIDASLSGDR